MVWQKKIANELSISENIVDNTLRKVCHKIGVNKENELAGRFFVKWFKLEIDFEKLKKQFINLSKYTPFPVLILAIQFSNHPDITRLRSKGRKTEIEIIFDFGI